MILLIYCAVMCNDVSISVLWTSVHSVITGAFIIQRKRRTFVDPLSPHDTTKHHFTSLKTDFIFLQLRVLEQTFP